MAQAAYFYAAGKNQEAEAKVAEAKRRTEEATADLRELQYWTEIANTILKLAQVVDKSYATSWLDTEENYLHDRSQE